MRHSDGGNRIEKPADRPGDPPESDASVLPTLDSAGLGASALSSGFAPPRVAGYRVIALLGRGAMGTVWRARDLTLERDVAIKLLHLPGGEEDAASTRVLREARAAGRLDHPNAVRLHHVSRDGRQISIVMELLAGGSLADLVEQNGPMPWREATLALREAAEGLGAAHAAGLVHRDVKPSNLLRSVSGRVKVADFGVARAGGLQSQLTTPGAIIGTPAYMSPEQCRGDEANLQCDLYGLGCTYYHLLTGKPPFNGDATSVMYQHCHEPFPDASRIVKELPPGVLAVLDRLTRKAPSDRYASATELIAELDRLLIVRGTAELEIPSKSWRTGTSARPVKMVAATLVLIVGGVVGGRWILHQFRQNQFAATPGGNAAMTAQSSKVIAPPVLKASLVLHGNRMASTSVGFSPDGRFVWSTGNDPAFTLLAWEARRWTLSTGGPAGAFIDARIAVSPSGEVVLNCRPEGGWAQRMDGSTPLCRWAGGSTPLDVSSDDRLIANSELQADLTPQLVVRTLPDGKEWFRASSKYTEFARFSPDFHYIAFANQRVVQVCDLVSRSELWLEDLGINQFLQVCFSNDGSRFLLWEQDDRPDGISRVYQTLNGRTLSLIRLGAAFRTAAISPDGHFVLFSVADHRRAAQMWNVDNNQAVTEFAPVTPPVSAVAISPDNRRALIGCEDGTLHLLTLPGGSKIGLLSGHKGRISAIAFSADGKLVASGAADLTVRVWGLP